MPLNIFLSDLDGGNESTLTKFAEDAKLCGETNTLERRVAPAQMVIMA